MIDLGLLISVALAISLPSAFQHRLGIRPPDVLYDLMIGPGIAGVLGGRAVAAAMDDPGALTSLKDFLVVRGGVEFWPGVAAAVAWLTYRAFRDAESPTYRMAQISGPAVIAYGIYEMACLVRDDCFGPASALGIRAGGLDTMMFPVGLVMGLMVVVGGLVVVRLREAGWPTLRLVLLSIAIVASVRAIGSFWLPDLASGLTRQHQQSIVVAVVSCGLTAVTALRSATHAPDPAS